jgi:hypothetical protein
VRGRAVRRAALLHGAAHACASAKRPGWRTPNKLPNKRATEQPTKDTNPKANQTAQTEPIAIRRLRRSALETVLSAARARTPSRLASFAGSPRRRAAVGPSVLLAQRGRHWPAPQPRLTADGHVCLFAERRARAIPAHDRMGPGTPLLQRCTDVAIYTIRLASSRASPMRVSSRVCRRAALGLLWV